MKVTCVDRRSGYRALGHGAATTPAFVGTVPFVIDASAATPTSRAPSSRKELHHG